MTVKGHLIKILPRRTTLLKWIKFSGLGLVLMLLSGCAQISHFKTDLTDMVTNLAATLENVWTLIWAFSYLAGIVLVLVGLFKFKRLGEMQGMMSVEHTAKEPLVPMLVGIALMFSVSVLDATLHTFFAYGHESITAYPDIGGLDWTDGLMEALRRIVQVIGAIVFVRGWLILSRLGAMHPQPGTLGKGLIHVIGGVMAINITGVLTILSATVFGT